MYRNNLADRLYNFHLLDMARMVDDVLRSQLFVLPVNITHMCATFLKCSPKHVGDSHVHRILKAQ